VPSSGLEGPPIRSPIFGRAAVSRVSAIRGRLGALRNQPMMVVGGFHTRNPTTESAITPTSNQNATGLDDSVGRHLIMYVSRIVRYNRPMSDVMPTFRGNSVFGLDVLLSKPKPGVAVGRGECVALSVAFY
jgi:hypothetical protein